ncbi:helix-turn-helix transcriptional regulator [Pseudomonas edaphica]|jgi:DNA-binding HxlR family transcriptional regulator|uniref:Helix-turn-helix transcriptional regulator n=1 Tax=Pseudomonas edaphica TaxID=2006980 RepID=A0A5R8QS68_9PSED|nr:MULTISPECIES: helix-turn-helix domain-containing protein [Pseudomonas]MDQ0704618.1 DNA-binding HxlR family transcriptional regulator [Pseudomonas sp. W3I7]NMX74067.1 helix-turn-helix transcriptional regulator [Pseudomonas sp. WS 5532]NVZ60179.1 helix-turn-helix transcriptional regulator [Pseudomonas edaphica]NWC43968.1 helix-turn-helix transcriptional regulator [Pseudomonas sp. IPO3747]NWE10386.1 helix-turn-helix transcriptional regulator [Pseudomonas edaphica]
MKRKCLEGDCCPVARALDVVGDWWTLLIIRDAYAGVTRFGDFQKHLGVAKNILATRLKDMVEQGLLQTSEVGARSEYQLTDKGRALMPVLVTLAQWGETFTQPADGATHLLDARLLKPLRKVEIVSEDGRVLGLEDIITQMPAA